MPRLLRRRGFYAIAVLVAAVGAAAAPSGAGWEPPPTRDFVDRLHGWRVDGVVDQRCETCDATGVFSTENGGRSWHVIFKDGSGNCCTALRTSVRAGLVTAGPPGRPYGWAHWTRDNGRHWYRFNRLGDAFTGRGAYLFTSVGSVVYRLTPWPPRGYVSCAGPWTRVDGWRVQRGGNICDDGETHDAGTGPHEVLRLPAGTALVSMADAPRGFVGVFDSSCGEGTLVVDVNARTRYVDLPRAADALPIVVRTRWPRISVYGSRCPDLRTTVVWTSPDGGATWTVR